MSVIVAKHIVSYLFSTCVLASPITLVLMGGGTSWLGSSGNSSILEEIQDIEIQTPKKTTAKNQHLPIANNTFSTHAASTYTPQKITEELKIKQDELKNIRTQYIAAWQNVKNIHNSGHNDAGHYNYIQDVDGVVWYNHTYNIEITPKFEISWPVTQKYLYTLWWSEEIGFDYVNTAHAERLEFKNSAYSSSYKRGGLSMTSDSYTVGMYWYYGLSVVKPSDTVIDGFEKILKSFHEEVREACRYARLITSKKEEIASFMKTHNSSITKSAQQ